VRRSSSRRRGPRSRVSSGGRRIRRWAPGTPPRCGAKRRPPGLSTRSAR
jgi:hypothetical protein